MKAYFSLLLFGGAALALIACGSGGDDGGGGGSGGNACDEADRTAYPEGPYGTAVGEIITNLEFTNQDDTAFVLGDIQSDAAKSLLFVATGAGWCTVCIEEQPTLKGWHADYGDQGLDLLVAINEDLNEQPATPALAESWADQYELTFPVVADPGFVLAPYFPSGNTDVQPLNMVIDLCTMEIIKSSVGADRSAMQAIIEARL